MAILRRFELARQYCSTTGTTGALVLGTAVPGYLTYAQAGAVDGDTVTYSAREGTNSEVGWGVYSTPPQITRNVIKSTNGDLPIDLAGSSEVFCGVHANDFGTGANQALLLDDAGKVPNTDPLLYNVKRRGLVRSLTSAGSVGAADRDALIFVSGAFTLSHTITAAVAGPGFRYTVRNLANNSTVTIDPAGSDAIEGAATLGCLAKQTFDVVSDGSSTWWVVGRQNIVLLDTYDVVTPVPNVIFNLPPDYFDFEVTIGNWTTAGTGPLIMQFTGVSSGYYHQMMYSNQALLQSVFRSNYGYVEIAPTAGADIGRGRGTVYIYPGAPGTPASFQTNTGAVASGIGDSYMALCSGYISTFGRQVGLAFSPSGGGGNVTTGRFTLTGRCR
jgi:hypothetical protein